MNSPESPGGNDGRVERILGEKVVMIDDELDNIMTLKMLFEKNSCGILQSVEVVHGMNTDGVFNKAMALEPTVILLDYSMGANVSAIELLKKFIEHIQTQGKKIIVIGFSSVDIFNREFLRNGAHGAVLKNGRNLLLMSEISEIVEKVRKEEQK